MMIAGIATDKRRVLCLTLPMIELISQLGYNKFVQKREGILREAECGGKD